MCGESGAHLSLRTTDPGRAKPPAGQGHAGSSHNTQGPSLGEGCCLGVLPLSELKGMAGREQTHTLHQMVSSPKVYFPAAHRPPSPLSFSAVYSPSHVHIHGFFPKEEIASPPIFLSSQQPETVVASFLGLRTQSHPHSSP